MRISDQARERARALTAERRFDDLIALWEAASPRERDDPRLLTLVGNAFARRGRWDDAATAYLRLVQRQPARNRNWVMAAPLLVYTERFDSYRSLRQEMLALFVETESPVIAERTAKASLLTPLSESAEQRLQVLAQRAVRLGSRHNYLPYFMLAQGLAEFRQGRHTAAGEALEEARKRHGAVDPYLDTLGCYVLAMVAHAAGQQDSAQQRFAEAEQLFAEKLRPGESEDFGVAWADWLICAIARREAERTVGR